MKKKMLELDWLAGWLATYDGLHGRHGFFLAAAHQRFALGGQSTFVFTQHQQGVYRQGLAILQHKEGCR
jgi:hypothetical protein